MSIKLGTNDLKELYLGNIKIKSAYFGNIAVYKDLINNPYYLTLLSNGYGSLIADALSGYNGNVVHLTATPNDDCHFIDYDSTACEIVGDDLTFGNSDCTAQANFGRNVHNVTTLTSNYGSISVNKNTGYSGDTFTLSNTPNTDCTFASYSITGATLTSNQFKMQKQDVSAKGTFNRNVHNVTLQNDGHGSIGANKTTGYSGDTITLSNTGNAGYSLSGYTITGATLTSNQFKIGTSNVTAKAWFKLNLNPYNLPNKTVRVRLIDGKSPLNNTAFVKTQISTSPNIWNIQATATAIQSLAGLIKPNTANILEIQGLNGSSLSAWASGFQECTKLTSICPLNMNGVKNAQKLFASCPNLNNITIYNCGTMYGMLDRCAISTANFYNYTSTDLGLITLEGNGSTKNLYIETTNNLSSITECCRGMAGLTSVKITNTNNVVLMGSAFFGCIALQTPPTLNYSNVSSCQNLFRNCSGLTSLPSFNFTNKIKYVGSAFNNCKNVRTGITAAYKSITSVNSSPGKTKCFYQCGSNTTQGAAELAQIPSTWK